MTIPQWREAVAGAAAGVVSRTVMAPVERLKLMKQLQITNPVLQNQSAWKILYLVYQEQGLLSFWRGNVPAVLRVAGTASINFTCMDYYKRAIVGPFLLLLMSSSSSLNQPLTEDKQWKKFVGSLMAGGLAGATSTTIMYPFDFARTRLAMDMGKDGAKTMFLQVSSSSSPKNPSSTTSTKPTKPSIGSTTTATTTVKHARQYKGMVDVLCKIIRSDGILGLYRGYGIALLGGIYFRILYLGGYDILKSEIMRQEQQGTIVVPNDKKKIKSTTTKSSSSSSSLSWTGRIVAAQTISLTAGTLSYPFDSVRRRMMMQSGLVMASAAAASGKTAAAATTTSAQSLYHNNSWECIMYMWRTEGIHGFFLGLGPNLVRSVGGALLLVAYDTIRDLL